MANYNTICTAGEMLVCTREEAEAIRAALEVAEDSDDFHGFSFEYEEPRRGYLLAEESGTPESLPEQALKLIGALVARNKLEYLEVGCAFTCSRLIPGSHGGTAFRIYPNGLVVYRVDTWPAVEDASPLSGS